MRAKLGNVYGITAIGPDDRLLEIPVNRKKLSSDPDNKFIYEKETRTQFAHTDENTELEYIKEYVIKPIEKVGEATYQNEYERWAYQLKDALSLIDERLSKRKYLLGDTPVKADRLLYKTLLRLDNIYYYIYKLNFAKSYDYINIKRYIQDLSTIKEIADSIDIVKEKEEAFLNLSDEQNPYHLVFTGPEN